MERQYKSYGLRAQIYHANPLRTSEVASSTTERPIKIWLFARPHAASVDEYDLDVEQVLGIRDHAVFVT